MNEVNRGNKYTKSEGLATYQNNEEHVRWIVLHAVYWESACSLSIRAESQDNCCSRSSREHKIDHPTSILVKFIFRLRAHWIAKSDNRNNNNNTDSNNNYTNNNTWYLKVIFYQPIEIFCALHVFVQFEI